MTRQEAEQERYFRRVQRQSELALHMASTMFARNAVADLVGSLEDGIEEYRSRKCLYSPGFLMSVVLIGLLLGENNIKNIETIIKNSPEKIKSWLRAAKGTEVSMPSDTTILRALHNVDYLDLLAVTSEWSSLHFGGKRRHIAVDGKANRACLERCFGKSHPPYIINAFNVGSGSIHAQIQVEAKTNEAGEFINLLRCMNLDGAFITGDAAFSNKEIAQAIIDADGHFILPIKGNQPHMQEAIALFMSETKINKPVSVLHFEDPDNGKHLHGRIAFRTYDLIIDGVDELLKGSSFEGIVHAIGRVHRVVEEVKYDENGNKIPQNPSIQEVYYIIDTPEITAEQFSGYVRDHWAGCEMIHYVLDVEFDEDRSRVLGRNSNGMMNLSLLRKAVVSIIKGIKEYSKTISIHTIRQDLRDCGGIPVLHISKQIENPCPESHRLAE